MARRADIQADLDLDSSGFRKGTQKAKSALKRFSSSAMGQLARVAGAFAAVGLVKKIIGLGTAAEETASKFNAVFGPAADGMNERLREMQKTIPASLQELQEATATIGAMTQAMGLNSEVSEEFSINMVKIAGDLASFNNMRPEEVFIKIRSAISGEFEPLKQLGIIINETTLKQEALTLGIWDGVGSMSASQKALVVQSLLVKQMGVATGDAAATVDSAANKMKFFTARLKDSGAELGETTLPLLVKTVDFLDEFAEKLLETAKNFAQFGRNIKAQFKDGFFSGIKNLAFGGVEGLRDLAEEAAVGVKKVKKEEDKLLATQIAKTRQKAGDDYLASIQKQIDAAGKLEGIVKATTKATKETAKESEKVTKATAKTVSMASGSGATGSGSGAGSAAAKRFMVGSASVRGATAGIGGSSVSRAFLASEGRLGGQSIPGAPTASQTTRATQESIFNDMRNSLKVIEKEMTV